MPQATLKLHSMVSNQSHSVSSFTKTVWRCLSPGAGATAPLRGRSLLGKTAKLHTLQSDCNFSSITLSALLYCKIAYSAILKVKVYFGNFPNLLLGLSRLSPLTISEKVLSRPVCKGREPRQMGEALVVLAPWDRWHRLPHHPTPLYPPPITLPSGWLWPPPVHQTLHRDSSLLQCLIGHTFLVFSQCFLSSHNVNYFGICPGLSPANFLREY